MIPFLFQNWLDLVLELHERRLVHRLDVDVGDLAVRRLVDDLAVLPHPLVVLQRVERGDRAQPDVALAGAGRRRTRPLTVTYSLSGLFSSCQ